MRRGRAVILACVSMVVACAQPSKDAKPPSSVQRAPEGPEPTSGGATDRTNVPAPAAQARGELTRAQNDLETALGASTADCASACRALASLVRATMHLCELSDPQECSEAQRRVQAARDRVNKACKTCD